MDCNFWLGLENEFGGIIRLVCGIVFYLLVITISSLILYGIGRMISESGWKRAFRGLRFLIFLAVSSSICLGIVGFGMYFATSIKKCGAETMANVMFIIFLFLGFLTVFPMDILSSKLEKKGWL